MKDEIKEIKIGMYTTDEILEFMTNGEGRGFMGRSMYDAILDYITNLQKEVNKLTVESTEWENRTYHWQDKAEVLQERCEYLQRSCERKEDEILSLRDECVDGEMYKSRIDKAIKYINAGKTFDDIDVGKVVNKIQNNLLNILGGNDKE